MAVLAAPSWMEQAGVTVLEEGEWWNPSVSYSYRPEGTWRPLRMCNHQSETTTYSSSLLMPRRGASTQLHHSSNLAEI